MADRKRKIWSVKNELLLKSREAMLSAVQLFNNPNILFKSESYIVLSIIAWTYLLHSYFRQMGIDYRYYHKGSVRKKFDKTKRGAYKYWELERCLNDDDCPIDRITCANLKFLIGLRHEIEHQMTNRIDDYLSARFQACCLNFNCYIKKFFGEDFGIDKHLSFSLQFSTISEEHSKQLREFSELPKNIASYIIDFDEAVEEKDFNSPQYSYRVLYVPKTVNNKGQADRVIEFLKADSPEAVGINKEYRVIREKEKPKHLPKEIVGLMKQKGFKKFGMHQHTLLWKELNAKDESKGFGVNVAGFWYWYDSWIKEVENYCNQNKNDLK